MSSPSLKSQPATPPPEPPASGESAKGRFTQLEMRRNHFLDRARYFAELTITSLLPPEGMTQTQWLPEKYSGFGATLVTSLASRLMVALLPPGTRSFRLDVPSEVLLQNGQASEGKDIEQGLALSEQAIQKEIEKSGWRPVTFTGLQHLIVTGNYMEETLPDNRIKGYRLDQFVVVRSASGKLLEFVISEPLSPQAIPSELGGPEKPSSGNLGEYTPLYTWGVRDDEGNWKVHQEFNDKRVEGSEGEFTDDTLPYRALRWAAVWGEDYGRSKIEDHYADLRSLEGLSKALVDGAAMASRNITMIRPNAAGGINLRRRLVKADNGDYLTGNPEDVEMLQFQNNNGMQFTAATVDEIKRDLAAAFLMKSAARRDAERVTAFELREMIEEIESVLGGVFTQLQGEIQQARIDRLVFQMKENRQLPDWPTGSVEVTVLTGLEALARERDVDRVRAGSEFLASLPQEVVQDYMKWDVYLGKGMNGLGLPDVVNSEDEANARRNARLEAEAMAQAAATVAGQAGQQSEEA